MKIRIYFLFCIQIEHTSTDQCLYKTIQPLPRNSYQSEINNAICLYNRKNAVYAKTVCVYGGTLHFYRKMVGGNKMITNNYGESEHIY